MRNFLYLAEFLLLALVLWAVLKPKKEKQKESTPILSLDEVEKVISTLNTTISNVELSTEKSIANKEKELMQLRSDLVKALQLRNKLEGLK